LLIFALCNYLDNLKTKDGRKNETYRQLKKDIANQSPASARRVILALAQNILVLGIATPLACERYTLNSYASCAGRSWG